MVAKIRPNVMVALMCGAVLTGLFGWWLIDRLDSGVSTEILAMLVGIGVGGMFTLAGLLAHDRPRRRCRPPHMSRRCRWCWNVSRRQRTPLPPECDAPGPDGLGP